MQPHGVCLTQLLSHSADGGLLTAVDLQDTPYKAFLQRVRTKLHCVLCLPAGALWQQLLAELPVVGAAPQIMQVPAWFPAALQVRPFMISLCTLAQPT